MAQALGLEIRTATGESRRLRFDAGPVTIGRDAENTIALEGKQCSPRHATIEIGEHGWMLSDTSAHGTDYNGIELRWGERVRLSHGDLLKIGDAELLVLIEDSPVVATVDSPARESVASVTPEPSIASADTTGVEEPAPRSAFERLMGAAALGQVPPRLYFSHSGEFVRELPLAEEGISILIGRDSGCDIVVPDPFRVVSKRHARIYRTWGGVFLEDLSQHGVYLNGERVRNIVALSHGDRITLSTVAQGSWGPVLVYLEATESARAAEATAFAESRARSVESAPSPEVTPRANEGAPRSAPASDAAVPLASSKPKDARGSRASRREKTPRGRGPAQSNGLVLIALAVAGIAVLGLVIGTILFFGKP